jgi:hypothetical protein
MLPDILEEPKLKMVSIVIFAVTLSGILSS